MSGCRHDALMFGGNAVRVGVLSHTDQPVDLGVVVVVGGRQYRAGAHRQFVSLSRSIARAGCACLRFDVGGMGDSPGPRQSFEALDDDIASAIEALRNACPGVSRVVLWGLCDGATAALLFSRRRSDVPLAGLSLVNPWLHSAQAQATARVGHYYPRRLRDPAFWRKLISGKVDLSAALRGWYQARKASSRSARDHAVTFVDLACAALRESMLPIQVVLADADPTAQEFMAAVDDCARGSLSRANFRIDHVADADHTFSTSAWQTALERAVIDWLRRL